MEAAAREPVRWDLARQSDSLDWAAERLVGLGGEGYGGEGCEEEGDCWELHGWFYGGLGVFWVWFEGCMGFDSWGEFVLRFEGVS